MTYEKVLETLQKEAEPSFRAFSEPIVATKEKVLGVRMPKIKELAEICAEDGTDFSAFPTGTIYEVDLCQLIASLLRLYNDGERYDFLYAFLPQVDGWAFPDTAVGYLRYPDVQQAYEASQRFLKGPALYVRRFGYINLMKIARWISPDKAFPLIHEDQEYFLNMAASWLLATVAIYHYPEVFSFLKGCRFPIIKKMTIRKCLDSRRISLQEKEELKSLR